MKHFGKIISFSIFMTLCVVFAPRQTNAQWGGGPVLVYDQTNGRGNESSFNIGTYRSDRGEFGSLRNDSARSIAVPSGYHVRLCENEGNGDGGGKCEDYGEGNHNLRYGSTASYIRVTGPSGGWAGGWNGGGQRGVTVFEDANSRGRSQTFGVGRYLNSRGQLGSLRNDSASSIVVAPGFRVRLCENEGNDANGSGRCEDYDQGRHNLRYNDSASFIEVRRSTGGGWLGGRWDTNGVFNEGSRPVNNGGVFNNGIFDQGRGDRPGDAVIVYEDRNQSGRSQTFGVGTFRNDQGSLGALKNDSASSIYVPNGYHVQLCESEGSGRGAGRCEDYGAGSYNLRFNDAASFIRVSRGR